MSGDGVGEASGRREARWNRARGPKRIEAPGLFGYGAADPMTSTHERPSVAGKGSRRPTSWWLAMLRRRAERMYEEKLDLSQPIVFSSPVERAAAAAFFNAAFRAEESGLSQAHALSAEVAAYDPDLAECLRLYGNEEGWHRELLTEFLGYLGGEVRPMGRITGTFYKV